MNEAAIVFSDRKSPFEGESPGAHNRSGEKNKHARCVRSQDTRSQDMRAQGDGTNTLPSIASIASCQILLEPRFNSKETTQRERQPSSLAATVRLRY